MQPLWVFLHIPKTAGSSFEACCRLNFTDAEQLHLDAHVMGLPPHRAGQSTRWENNAVRDYIKRNANLNLRYVHGHLAYLGLGKVLAPNRETRYFTFLRNPVRRVVSLYGYVKSQHAHHWHEEIVANDWTLLQWMEKSGWLERFNGQVRRLLLGCEDTTMHDAALHAPRLEPAHLDFARQRLRECWFLGSTETFHDDAHYLYGALGFRRFAAEYVVNRGPLTAPPTSEEEKLIAAGNTLDEELYLFARQLRAEYVRRHATTYHACRLRAMLVRRAHRVRSKLKAGGAS